MTWTTRHALAGWAVALAVVGGVIAVFVLGPITRGPGFHVYADQRAWIGIPHAGDVLSNLGFLLVAAWLRPAALTGVPGATAVCSGIAVIGLGSGAYHVAPSDALLVLDWLPIAITVMLVVAVTVRDRLGDSAGLLAFALGPLAAVGAVGYWYLTGGTGSGGDMAPYVVIQALGVGLPPVIAAVAPGRVGTGWLVAAVGAFAFARVLAARDAALLDAIGISGHSLKHLAAAAAAGLALRGMLTTRRDR
jgi:hypothetical protein